MDFPILNDDNYMFYAMKAYEAKNFIVSEFEEDLKRIKYLKKLLRKYHHDRDLKERLILNHIIILSNVFGVEATTRLLFLKMHPEDYSTLKTFLLFLNFMPNVVQGIYGNNIMSSDVPINLEVVKRLREI